MDQPLDVVREHFLKAIELDSRTAQLAYVDAHCGDDAELRQQVKRLLHFHHQADDLSQRPDDADRVNSDDSSSPRSSLSSATYDRYEIGERLGEGGFGEVFQAEQTTPVRRQVALKLILPGMNSRDVLTRFEAERQALARMNHPYIANIFDAGTTPDGRPFFAMELVEGNPITEFCDAFELPLRRRLCLFLQVCEAVQHSHQRGIIHRDLKPSNVLMSSDDVDAVPKVIDFGTAKALEQDLVTGSPQTSVYQIIGSLTYMAPEQARRSGSGIDVDTRADIYSLGILLYELLTGTTPLLATTDEDAGLLERMRFVVEGSIPRPSDLLQQDRETAEARTAAGQPDLRPFISELRGDLDWIVLQALQKDREQRYATAGEFAMDIKRFLGHLPTMAGPPSRVSRLRKYIKRNRATISAVSLVVTALLAGLWMARRQAQRAVSAERLAETRFQELAQAQNKALDTLRKAEESRAQLLIRDRLSRQMIYALDMTAAFREWQAGDIAAYTDLLAAYDVALGEEDLRGFEWYLLKSLGSCWSEALELGESRKCCVRCLGQRICIGDYDGNLVVVDAATRRPIHRIAAHDGFVNHVDISPDGSELATIGDDGLIRIWDANTASMLGEIRAVADGAGHRVLFAMGGDRLVSSDGSGNIRVWDRMSLSQVASLTTPPKPNQDGCGKYCLAVSPNGARAVACIRNWEAYVFDLYTNHAICKLDAIRHGKLRCLTFSRDNRYVAGSRDSLKVTVWDARTGALLHVFAGHRDDIQDVSFHPSLPLLASSDKAGVVRIWQLGEGSEGSTAISQWPSVFVGSTDRIWSLDFAANENFLATASREGVVRLWHADAAAPMRLHPAEKQSSELYICWINNDSLALATMHDLQQWDIRRDTVESSVALEPSDWPRCLAQAAKTKVYFSGHEDGVIRGWNVDHRGVRHWQAYDEGVDEIAVTSDGRLVVSSSSGDVVLWEAATGKALSRKSFANHCSAISIAPDNHHIAFGVDNDIFYTTLSLREPPLRLAGHTNTAECLVFSTDGRTLISASDDRTIRIWDLETRATIHTISGHDAKIEALDLSPDGQTIATGTSRA